MPTSGRNDPCPCGSGKKYKKCCLARDEAAAQAKRDAVAPAKPPVSPSTAWTIDEDDDLDRLSNHVVDLIQQGKFDDAARARDLLRERYPEMIDSIERTAMLEQARGNLSVAIEWWNKTLDFMQRDDGFDDDGRDAVRDIITGLEQQVAARNTPIP